MFPPMRFWLAVVLVISVTFGAALHNNTVEGFSRTPRRILLDTDVDTDDFFALLYLLKLNRSEFQLEVSKNKKQSTKIEEQQLPLFPYLFFVMLSIVNHCFD